MEYAGAHLYARHKVIMCIFMFIYNLLWGGDDDDESPGACALTDYMAGGCCTPSESS